MSTHGIRTSDERPTLDRSKRKVNTGAAKLHTNMSVQRLALAALLAVAALHRDALAQNPPARLPAVVVEARPDMPGPRKIAGIVRDTFALPIEGVEFVIPELQRKVSSRPDGSFRFDDVKPGTYTMRARKIGFHPQIQDIVVDDSGGVAVFALLATARVLPPSITSAERGGLSGRVGDTAFRAVPAALVRVMGHQNWTTTDSLGAFFMPLEPGSYLVSVTREGFDYKLFSVRIPRDSGRSVTVFLPPRKAVPLEQAHNLDDLMQRMGSRSGLRSRIYTHDELEEMHVEWGLDAVKRGIGAVGNAREMWVDPDCSVIVNGGPETVELNTLTIDQIETVEVYSGGNAPPMPNVARGGRGIPSGRGANRASMPRPATTNTRLAALRNATKTCPLAYVWLR